MNQISEAEALEDWHLAHTAEIEESRRNNDSNWSVRKERRC